jgi:DNA-binding transcriptional regulator YiaG
MRPEIASLRKIKSALQGDSLLRLLKDAGVTRGKFCRDIGITWATCYWWTKGKSKPSDDNALKAALYLGLIDPGGSEKIRLERDRAEIDRQIKAIEKNKIR